MPVIIRTTKKRTRRSYDQRTYYQREVANICAGTGPAQALARNREQRQAARRGSAMKPARNPKKGKSLTQRLDKSSKSNATNGRMRQITDHTNHKTGTELQEREINPPAPTKQLALTLPKRTPRLPLLTFRKSLNIPMAWMAATTWGKNTIRNKGL